MKKTLLLSLLALSVAIGAYAQDGNAPRPLKEMRDTRATGPQGPRAELRTDLRADVRLDRQDFKKDKVELRNETRADIQANRADTKAKIEAMRAAGGTLDREAIKDRMEERKAKNAELRTKFKSQMETKRTEFKAGIKAKFEQFKAGKMKLSAERKAKVAEHLGHALARLTAATENIAAFNARLEVIIDKREESGADVSVSADLLVKANEALETAKVKVAAVKEATTEEVADAEGTAKEALHTAVNEAVTAIKDAKAASKAVVDSLPKPEKVEVSAETKVEGESVE